ncbi:MAG: dehydrogenase [Lentisphaerae bacterium RIFOXYA12_FULL_48_11]|nr:MAG: dehydrogenase [Lentisphaerae bacterium RIFOXYA12_FULL_48_11]
MKKISAGVIGLGFIGAAHVEALRRVGGVEVVAVSDANAASLKRAAEGMNVPKAYEDYRELLNDRAIDAVHICTPNAMHFKMVKDALEAGKHVICEKPLAVSVTEAESLVKLAEKTGLRNAVNFNIRFYPLIQELRGMVAAGELGDVFAIHGSYLQDWLFYDTDYNWRLEPALAGESRAVADIGSHWMDAIEHIAGLKIVEVLADFATFHKQRKKPSRPVETYSGKLLRPEDYVAVDINTEDYATVVLGFSNGARGVLTVSQVAAGRKNRLSFEIDASKKAVSWDSERPNEMWLGDRDRANEMLFKDPSLVKERTRKYISYPGGHNEGFPDTFKQLYREFYSFVSGEASVMPCYATFRDGLRELQLCEKIVESSRKRAWVKI